MAKKKMGRPQIEIDKGTFEKLCGIQCTLNEIAGWFDCSPDTIERWCEREYGQTFADTYELKRGKGLISLRRNQWKMAETNPTMAIFLGKQHLGQSDKVESRNKIESDGFMEALKGQINEVFNNSEGIVEE